MHGLTYGAESLAWGLFKREAHYLFWLAHRQSQTGYFYYGVPFNTKILPGHCIYVKAQAHSHVLVKRIHR